MSQALVRVLQELRESAVQELINASDDTSNEVLRQKKERVKVYTEILDLDNLLLGEIGDVE